MDAQPCVYILASKQNGTLYTGVTRYLPQGNTSRASYVASQKI